jgi:hypothetical protein
MNLPSPSRSVLQYEVKQTTYSSSSNLLHISIYLPILCTVASLNELSTVDRIREMC